MNINFTLISQALWFAVFVWFTAKFVWPPLMRAIEDRQKKIADGLAAAERGQHELETANVQVQELLSDAKQQSQDLLANAQKRADEIVEEAKTTAKEEGERQIAAARATIEQETSVAREELRDQVSTLALSGARQILMREVDVNKHREVLEQLGARL